MVHEKNLPVTSNGYLLYNSKVTVRITDSLQTLQCWWMKECKQAAYGWRSCSASCEVDVATDLLLCQGHHLHNSYTPWYFGKHALGLLKSEAEINWQSVWCNQTLWASCWKRWKDKQCFDPFQTIDGYVWGACSFSASGTANILSSKFFYLFWRIAAINLPINLRFWMSFNICYYKTVIFRK